MKLESLYLSLDKYGASQGQYTGQLTFASELGKVEIKLSPATSNKILKIVADEIVSSAREVAYDLTREVIEAVIAPREEKAKLQQELPF